MIRLTTWKPYLAVAFFLLLIYVAVVYLLPLVLPFLLGAFLAALLEPAVGFLHRSLRLPRPLAVSAAFVLSLVLLLFIIAFGVTGLAVELQQLLVSLPAFYEQVVEFSNFLIERYNEVAQFAETLSPSVQLAIQEQLAEWYQTITPLLNTTITVLQSWFLLGLPNLVVLLLISGIAAFFLSLDRHKVERFLLSLVPPETRSGVARVGRDVLASTVGLTKAQLLLVFLTFLVTLTGLSLLDAPYALSISAVAALMDIIPVIGPSLIFLPWSLYHLLMGDLVFGLWLLALYGGVSLVRTVAQAHVISGQIGLHPLATLVALFVGAKVFGPIGLIIGPLVAIVLKSMVLAGLLPFGWEGPKAAG